MYLFGFPEGLAGGSKETSYQTNFDTTVTTYQSKSAQVFVRNTSYVTSYNTSRSTSYLENVFHSGYGVENLYKASTSFNNGTNIYISKSNLYVNLIRSNKQTGDTLHGSAQQGSVTWSTTSMGLVPAYDGNDPQDNVGRIFYGIKVGTYIRSPKAGAWEYAVTFSPVSSQGVMPVTVHRPINVNTPAPYTTGGTISQNRNTSWGTSRTTSRATYRTSTWNSNFATTWETIGLTSHITYG